MPDHLSCWVHPDGSFEDYRVLSVCFQPESRSAHQILFKAHTVDTPCPEKPLARTLFLLNIPPWATPQALRRLFAVNGPIQGVFFQKQPSSSPPPPQTPNLWSSAPDARIGSGFKCAYIVFERPSSVHKALKKMNLSRVRVLGHGPQSKTKKGEI